MVAAFVPRVGDERCIAVGSATFDAVFLFKDIGNSEDIVGRAEFSPEDVDSELEEIEMREVIDPCVVIKEDDGITAENIKGALEGFRRVVGYFFGIVLLNVCPKSVF